MFFDRFADSGGYWKGVFVGEGFIAPDFLRLFQKAGCGIGNQAHGEMGDGHLVFDGSEFVVSRLVYFSVAKASEVAFDFGSFIEGVFKESGIALDVRARVICDIEIFSTAVGFTL